MSASIGNPATAEFSANGVARASADFGTLRAFGRFDGLGQHTGTISVGAKASASFQDTFFINDAALNGSPGTVSIPLDFAWSVIGASTYPPGTGFSADNQFSVRFFAPNGSQTIASFFREQFDTSGSLGQTASTQVAGIFNGMPFTFQPTVNVNFIFGEAIKVVARLDIGISATDFSHTGITSLFGIDDAGHSAYWGGFASVVDGNGQPVTSYSVSAASGVDWSQSFVPSIPEPASAALLLAGLGLVLSRSAWRNRKAA